MEPINVELFGNNPKVVKAISYAKSYAQSKTPLLLVGEKGVGKKTLGRYIHHLSGRENAPFLIVNCAEESQKVENMILGYREEETGRFVRGVLENANGGTVILENIDGLEDKIQNRLYNIFQELADYEIDVRIIATTTKNLSKLVGAGRFYRALYTYVSSLQIFLPPLRERTEDIEFLAYKFLEDHALENDIPVPQISEEAKKKLLNHYWTHNILELKKIMANILDHGVEEINVTDLSMGEKKSLHVTTEEDDDGLKLMSLKEAEKLLIRKALIHTSENRTQAAKILGVSIRTLRNKINEYRIQGSNYFINLR